MHKNRLTLLVISGPLEALNSKCYKVDRGTIVGLALDTDTPTFTMTLNSEAITDDTLALATTPLSVAFDDKKVNIAHVFITKDFVGYVADTEMQYALGVEDFNKALQNGTFTESFGTGYALVNAEKIAYVGTKDSDLKVLEIANFKDLHAKTDFDGLRIVTGDAAYFVAKTDLTAWLDGKTEFKATKVATFGGEITTISRPTNDDIYYVSGPTISYKVFWKDGETCDVLDTMTTKNQVLGPVANANNTIVMGTVQNSTEGQTATLTFKPANATKLGYTDQAAIAK